MDGIALREISAVMKLTTDDLAFFKRNGYLIKRGVLDPALMARARERLWDGAPPSLRREEPATWVGPIAADDESEDKLNYRKGFRWQYREPGSEAWMVRLLASEPRVWGMAEQLLGAGQLVPPERIRGIYCTLPFGDHPLPPIRCHVDAHPFHLGVVGYVDDVAPGGGGFAVWPGSHRKFYYAFHSQYRYEPTEDYERIREECHRIAPIDCHGNAGDVVFWHHRIAHLAAANRSDRIRQAVLYDFRKQDLDRTQEEPPCPDMWRDWSAELQAIDA
jgi:hypothetical protein